MDYLFRTADNTAKHQLHRKKQSSFSNLLIESPRKASLGEHLKARIEQCFDPHYQLKQKETKGCKIKQTPKSLKKMLRGVGEYSKYRRLAEDEGTLDSRESDQSRVTTNKLLKTSRDRIIFKPTFKPALPSNIDYT